MFNGPKPQPSPITSNSMVYSTTFSNTIGSAYQPRTSVARAKPSVVPTANSHAPRMYSATLTT
ncbi:Uncharacterised protein [Mycobacterium tuberculosis]|nr:Uncharacterised protein [Mycobacterium tuberculosis]